MKLTPQQIIELEDETVLLCQEMIRIPSVNHGEGRGDEKAMAEYVVKRLSEVGIATESIVSAPNRVNVVAKIAGVDQSRPGLVLHGHIDVVPANAEATVSSWCRKTQSLAWMGNPGREMRTFHTHAAVGGSDWRRNQTKQSARSIRAYLV